MNNNPYVRYYLDQQGHGMSVFRGSAWQKGHGQMGYGLGGLFCSVARTVMPMVKSGAKALGNIALKAGANVLGDVASGKNLKAAIKNRGKDAANIPKDKAFSRLQTYVQTGNGKRKRRTSTSTARSRQTKRRKTAVKKRKASTSRTRSNQTKKRKTAPDIFG